MQLYAGKQANRGKSRIEVVAGLVQDTALYLPIHYSLDGRIVSLLVSKVALCEI